MVSDGPSRRIQASTKAENLSAESYFKSLTLCWSYSQITLITTKLFWKTSKVPSLPVLKKHSWIQIPIQNTPRSSAINWWISTSLMEVNILTSMFTSSHEYIFAENLLFSIFIVNRWPHFWEPPMSSIFTVWYWHVLHLLLRDITLQIYSNVQDRAFQVLLFRLYNCITQNSVRHSTDIHNPVFIPDTYALKNCIYPYFYFMDTELIYSSLTLFDFLHATTALVLLQHSNFPSGDQ